MVFRNFKYIVSVSNTSRMLLLELLSRLQNSNTSLLFWNLFTGLKFLNELNIKSSLSLTKVSILLSLCSYMTSYLFSLLTVTTQSNQTDHHHSKSLTAPSGMLHLIFGTSFLHHSGFFVQIILHLSATFIWTCRFNLLHSAITFYYFFTVSLWAQNLPVQKILSSTLVCFCLSDWSHGSTLFTGLTCSSVFMF